jgi:hypothetical protein
LEQGQMFNLERPKTIITRNSNRISLYNNVYLKKLLIYLFIYSIHSITCPQRKPVINEHFVKNTSFFMVFVWNRTCTQRKLSITSKLFPPEQIFVQTNLFTTNFHSTFFCSQVKNQV